MGGAAPATKNHPAPNVHSAEAGKPCIRSNHKFTGNANDRGHGNDTAGMESTKSRVGKLFGFFFPARELQGGGGMGVEVEVECGEGKRINCAAWASECSAVPGSRAACGQS